MQEDRKGSYAFNRLLTVGGVLTPVVVYRRVADEEYLYKRKMPGKLYYACTHLSIVGLVLATVIIKKLEHP